MFNHDCAECQKNSKLLEEKEKILCTYQSNMFELKSKMSETSNLINVYFNYKNENEILKKEIESLKKKVEGSIASNSNAKINYEIELLRNKFLKECEKSKAMESANTQLSAMIDEMKANQDVMLKNENAKLKKDISDKERQINTLNSNLDNLRNELSMKRKNTFCPNNIINQTKLVNENLETNEFNQTEHFDNLLKCEFDMVMDKIDLPRNASINKHQNEVVIAPSHELVKENEYLKRKFQKYQIKYIKFKYKYKTLKSFKSFTKFNIYEEDSQTLLKKKKQRSEQDRTKMNCIVSRKNSALSKSELFDNKNNYMFESILDINEEVNSKPVKTKKKKSTGQDILNNPKKSETPEKHKKIENKIPVTKSFKNSLKKFAKETKKIKVVDNPEEEKIPDNNLSNPLSNNIPDKIHIGPIKKMRVDLNLLIQKQKEELFESFSCLVTSINFQTELAIEKIHEFLPTMTTHEKVFKILDLLIDYSNKFEVTHILFFLKIFIVHTNNEKIILNFNEYFFTNIDHILSLESEYDLSIDLFNKYRENVSPDLDITSDDNKTYFLISFVYAIFFKFTNIGQDMIMFIYELINKANHPSAKSVLKLFSKMTQNKSYQIDPIYETTKNSFSKNFNKVYFLKNYLNNLISQKIFDLLFLIIKNIDNEDSVSEILNSNILKCLSHIDSDNQLKENENHKINLSESLDCLELVQVIEIARNLKGEDWVYRNIFQQLLWSEFISTKQESIKRVKIIFFISYVFSLLVNKDSLLQKQESQEILSWLCAIINPTFTDQKITIYDKIAALSGIIDSQVIFSLNLLEMVRVTIKSLLTSKEVFPEDFLEKLKKLKILD